MRGLAISIIKKQLARGYDESIPNRIIKKIFDETGKWPSGALTKDNIDGIISQCTDADLLEILDNQARQKYR